MPGDPVEHLLAEMAERRVAEVVRERGGLDHVVVAAAEFLQQPRGVRRRAVSRSAIARATCATLRLCVSRLCSSSPEPFGLTTWVTPASRAKNGELATRSRSARNGLRGQVALHRFLAPAAGLPWFGLGRHAATVPAREMIR